MEKEKQIGDWFEMMNILTNSGQKYHCALGILKPEMITIKDEVIIPKKIYQDWYEVAKEKLKVPSGNVSFWSEKGIVRISAHTPEGGSVFVELDLQTEKSEIRRVLEHCWKILPFNVLTPISTLEEFYEGELI